MMVQKTGHYQLLKNLQKKGSLLNHKKIKGRRQPGIKHSPFAMVTTFNGWMQMIYLLLIKSHNKWKWPNAFPTQTSFFRRDGGALCIGRVTRSSRRMLCGPIYPR